MVHPTYKQPNREPVQKLIEFDMSGDDLHTNHDEKSYIHTVEEVQSEPVFKWYTEAGPEPSLP